MTKLIIFALIVILLGFTMIDTCEGLTIDDSTTDTNFTTNPNTISRSIPSTHDDANNNHIQQQHVNLQQMREEIHEDLMEIQKHKTSIYAEQKLAYDRTIYGTLMMTVIATCLIYFIFVEL
tara:strand:- start:109 stop:471 length:363 start_codon:yes stop_codon:yes gene_type:complete